MTTTNHSGDAPRAAVAPRLSASVLLLREGEPGLEVLMLRRHSAMTFGGAWVFPGGSVDAADRAAQICGRIPEAQQTRCIARLGANPIPPITPESALALFVAACREIFEETGILLAHGAGKQALLAPHVERIQTEREAVAERASAFVELLVREDLHLDLDGLVFWTHWVTPSLEPKRFDTRFFAIEVPSGQTVLADTRESSEFAWVQPSRMLDPATNGGAMLMPPTHLTLLDLIEMHTRHGSVRAMLEAEQGRVVVPILPRMQRIGADVATVYPWDLEYGSGTGEGLEWSGEVPAHLKRLPSRLVLAKRPQAK
jgi:8-oxo-dGTP pyrophosphatase MutT (NUDIX family)